MKKPDWKKARALFPALKKYTFVNAAGGAPLARPVAEAGAAYYKEALRHGDAYWERWLERLEESRAELAKLIGASPREVAFTLNTSHGMSLVAGALKGRGTVLTMRDEFPSTTLAWLNAGYKVKFAEPWDNRYPVDYLAGQLTPDIKILVTSYVQYRTGFRQDLEALGRLCRRRGVILVVNATQALGAMPVNAHRAGMDFMVFSCFKWTMAGYGAAGLYAAGKWLPRLKFPEAGWRAVARPEQMDNTAREMKREASAAEVGCVHFPCIFALGAAARLLNGLGVGNIQRRILQLNDYLEAGLAKLGLETATPPERGCRSGITIIKAARPARAVAALERLGIMTAARGAGVRVSLHFYNNERDLDRLLAGLKRVLAGFISAVILAGLGAAAQACSCAPRGPLAETYAAADAVFSGEVLEGRWEGRRFVAKFRVAGAWKGVNGSTAAVETGSFVSGCGVRFERGGSYLVYAQRAAGGLATNVCLGTRRLYSETGGAEKEPGLDAAARKRFEEARREGLAAQRAELAALDALAGGAKGEAMTKTVYDFTVKDAEGAEYPLAAFKGKVLLIVNVASKCGFTPQYGGLEELHKKYAAGGLAVLGFPCNQFGDQEPGSNREIQHFCRLNYGVSFPVLGKLEVNGAGADPLYAHLKAAAPGVLGSEAIKWNFTKFLVDRDGRVIGRYSPATKPEALVPDIEKALGK
ncbi:MAG TPA: hypothetical protein DCQ25_12055 [Elusimicrobia bacterium]|nr:hypothetical protein [Elusimicrobiota bacterium]